MVGQMSVTRPQRAIAATIAGILCAVGVLARYHQAEEAHVRDGAGAQHHAQHLAEQHESSATAHLHGRAGDGHTGECTLLAIAHQPVALGAPAPTAALPPTMPAVVAAPPVLPAASIEPYRLAPKTSPPG
jgi:hypothetical protein